MKKEFKIVFIILILFLSLVLISNFKHGKINGNSVFDIFKNLFGQSVGTKTVTYEPKPAPIEPFVINQCNTVINIPGYYVLNKNINASNINSSAVTCITIDLNNYKDVVTIDCHGYSIIGKSILDDVGIWHNKGTINIKNCNFYNLFESIALFGGNNYSTIKDNFIFDSYYGIVIGSSGLPRRQTSKIEISNNNIENTIGNDIILLDVHDSKLNYNNICGPPSYYQCWPPSNVCCEYFSSNIDGESYFRESNCDNLVRLSCDVQNDSKEEMNNYPYLEPKTTNII